MTEKNLLNIARTAGKGNANSASAVLVPTVDRLSQAETGEKPALFIVGVLTSEKPVGADKILDVTFQTMADQFYSERGKVIKRLGKVADESQDILADLFFKAGFGDEPFRVTLDLGMLALQDGAFSVWTDGEVSISIVRGEKSLDLRKAYGKQDQDRFEGSGKLKKGDKIFMYSNFVEKKDWVLDQLKAGSLKPQALFESMGKVSDEEAMLVVDYGGLEKAVAAEESSEEPAAASVPGPDSVPGPRVKQPKASVEIEPKVSGVGGEDLPGRGDGVKPKKSRAGSKIDWKEIQNKAKGFWQKVKASPIWGRLGDLAKAWWQNVAYALSALLARVSGSPRRRVLKKADQDTGKIVKGVVGLVLVVGLCVLLAVFANKKFNNRKEIQAYQESYDSLEADVVSLENSLGDLTYSKSEKIDNANALISRVEELKNNEYADEEKLNELITRVNSSKDTLTDTYPFSDVNVLADMGVSLDGASPVDFDIKGDSAYVLDAGGNKVYTVDLSSGEISLYASSDIWYDPKYIAWSENYLLVYDAEAGMFKVNESGGVEKVVGLSALQFEVSEFTTYDYADNLYFLVPEKRKIYKSTEAGSGFSIPQEYNDSPFPTNSVDATIDGAIYVIGEGGEIKKFDYRPDSSVMSNIAVSGLQEPLGSNCMITTPLRRESGQRNYLYILDSSGKRIVVINKDQNNGNDYIGALAYRGGSPWFENLKEIKLTQSESYAVVLDGSALLKIDLSQI